MLSTTGLPIERIGKLTGLGTRASMHRKFRQIAHMTPGSYRRRHSPDEYTPPELRVPAPR